MEIGLPVPEKKIFEGVLPCTEFASGFSSKTPCPDGWKSGGEKRSPSCLHAPASASVCSLTNQSLVFVVAMVVMCWVVPFTELACLVL